MIFVHLSNKITLDILGGVYLVLNILKGLALTAKDIIPVSLFLIVFQIFVLKSPIGDIKPLILGIVLSTVGLYMFIKGLEIGLMPLGSSVGSKLPLLDNKLLVIAFAFILGYTTTLAEPALASLAMEIEELSVGTMNNKWLIHAVATGVGIGISLGMIKIMYSIPYTHIIIPMVLIASILAYFAPNSITGIAFDSGGVTTGPVTVPLNMALAIGLSSVISGSDPLLDGFGIIGLASITPIIAVLLLGIIVKF